MPGHTGRVGVLVLAVFILGTTLGAGAAGLVYRRQDWRHWVTVPGECLNTRARVLLRDAVVVAPRAACGPVAGEWRDPYTGTVFTVPGELDVDHLVPLKAAHESGAAAWSKADKERYANDLGYRWHLLSVSASANREKGAKGPDAWRPARREFWCQYGQAWAAVKFTWGLAATDAERAAVRELVVTCR